MSRKSKRNTPQAAVPGPNQPHALHAAPSGRRGLFIATAVGLLIAFVIAALAYQSRQATSRQGVVRNSGALASTQSPSAGNPDAKVHLVEFLDPACGTCAAFFPQVKQLMAAHPGRIRLSLRHVPFHKGSDLVVKILEASRDQGKYMSTLEGLYAVQGRWVVNHEVQADAVWQVVGSLGLDIDRLRRDLDSPEIARRMETDMADAQTLGVNKTPEFFVNGQPLPSFGLDELKTLVNEEVRRTYR